MVIAVGVAVAVAVLELVDDFVEVTTLTIWSKNRKRPNDNIIIYVNNLADNRMVCKCLVLLSANQNR